MHLPRISSLIEYLGLLVVFTGNMFFIQVTLGSGSPATSHIRWAVWSTSTAFAAGDFIIFGKPGGSLSAGMEKTLLSKRRVAQKSSLCTDVVISTIQLNAFLTRSIGTSFVKKLRIQLYVQKSKDVSKSISVVCKTTYSLQQTLVDYTCLLSNNLQNTSLITLDHKPHPPAQARS